MSQPQKMIVSESGTRLDIWLSQHDLKESRSTWQKRITAGEIRVNKKKVTPHHKLREGDHIEISTPKSPSPAKNYRLHATDSPTTTPLAILFEDKNYLVIDKPAGLVVHPGSGHKDDTLVERLEAHTKTLSTMGGGERPGIVHRLDKDTSGVMVIAKNNETHRWLTDQFMEKKVKKEYIALVHGRVEPREGSIEAPLTRNQKNRTKIQVSTGQKSRYALTHYHVEHTFSAPFPASLLSITIETGRTHQIRVHLEAIGHPVIGDSVYTRRDEHALDKTLGLSRQFLHAESLEFISPTTKKKVKYRAPLPLELKRVSGVFHP